LLSITCNLAFAIKKSPIIGVITAMPSEALPIKNALTNIKQVKIKGVSYFEGWYKKKQITLVVSGIGKIDAAVVTTKLISTFHPKMVILSGIAGSLNSKIKIGDIVVGKKVYAVEHLKKSKEIDSDEINPIKGQANPFIFMANKDILNKAMVIANKNFTKSSVFMGTIATTDIFPPSKYQVDELSMMHVDALEMEGFAVAQVAWLFNTPAIIIRGISDYPDKVCKADKMNAYDIGSNNKLLAEQNVSAFVLKLITRL